MQQDELNFKIVGLIQTALWERNRGISAVVELMSKADNEWLRPSEDFFANLSQLFAEYLLDQEKILDDIMKGVQSSPWYLIDRAKKTIDLVTSNTRELDSFDDLNKTIEGLGRVFGLFGVTGQGPEAQRLMKSLIELKEKNHAE